MPIGPFVQPTLLENWVSALFELFGNNPLIYVSMKKGLVMGMIALGFLMWTWVGQRLGLVPEMTNAGKKKRKGEQRNNISKKRNELVDETTKHVFTVSLNKYFCIVLR